MSYERNGLITIGILFTGCQRCEVLLSALLGFIDG